MLEEVAEDILDTLFPMDSAKKTPDQGSEYRYYELERGGDAERR